MAEEAATKPQESQPSVPGASVPVHDMDRLDGRCATRGASGRKIWKWVGRTFLVLLLCAVGFCIFAVHRFYHAISDRPNQQLADNAAIMRPENYIPAGIYLARLMQTDPALWDSDSQDYPACDWLPSELGRVHLWEPTITRQSSDFAWGGGGDDTLGRANYHVDADPKASAGSRAAYILYYGYAPATVDGSIPAHTGEYHFTIDSRDCIGEEEFVRRGLAELSRRRVAYAAGTEVNVYGDDPASERTRLLAQHPSVATKLRQTDPALVNGP